MSEERDTHFQGFASVVIEDLYKITIEHLHTYGLHYSQEELTIKQRQIIAQRAYDLVKHTLTRLDLPEYINDIPDLTEWPEK